MPPWVLLVAGVLIGGSGIAGLLSPFFNRSATKVASKAKVVDQAIDVLDRLTQRQTTTIERQDAMLAKKDERIAKQAERIAELEELVRATKPGRNK